MKGIVQFLKENKPYPREDESVLHYLVCTENRDFESAIRCLRMAVREWHGISRLALGISSATFLISLLSAASGVGAWVALSLVSTLFTGSQAWGSRRESQVREKELELLKSHPELLELMHQAYSKGVPALKLVHSYNAIVGAFDTSEGTCQGTMPVQALKEQMQGAIATAKEVHQVLGQLDIGELPASELYPHLSDSKPSLPPGEPPQQPVLQDKPSGSAPTTPQQFEHKPVETIPSEATSAQPKPIEHPLQQKSDCTPEPIQKPAPMSQIDSTSEQLGLEVLNALASTRRSTLLIGDTGAGKSVTQSYILTKLFELHPDAEVFALAQKADAFCGLSQKGRVTLFDPTEPEHALILIGNIWKIYDKRRRLPESARPGLSPVRLILADWLSINQALEELLREEPVKSSKYLTKLADIIYNGRELNVCLLVDLQSYNLAAVGLKADRNSRKNFNLLGLGNYSIDELGMVNESYGVLINLIGDRYIVASESERTALNATFKQLQPISKAHQRPIIFSGLSPARLALLPDLRKYKTSTVAAATKQPVTTPQPINETEPEEEALEPNEATTELKVSDVLAGNLKEPLKTIWLFARKRNCWITVRHIYDQKFKVLEGKKVEPIHQYLGLLADSGLGEIDEDGKAHSAVGFRAY